MNKYLVSAIVIAMFAASTISASAQGGSGGGGSATDPVGSPTGGGGATIKAIPQVAGKWRGQEAYDPSLGVFIMNPPLAMTLNEDTSGNISGIDSIMSVSVSGKASDNGTVLLQDGAYYGQKLTGNITGAVTCSDGTTGQVLSGKFQRKEGFGTFSMTNCPS